jgi:cyclopropane-fatty-acyl-phospholipid synthase
LGLTEPSRTPPARSRATDLDFWLVGRILEMLGNPPMRFRLWNGKIVCISAEEPLATVTIGDRSTLLRLVFAPDMTFGDGYADGRIRVEGDLVRLIETVFRSNKNIGLLNRMIRFALTPLRRRNTLRGSRDNIHHHYDLGNDFYRLWLDEQLAYTCAYFPTPDASLEQAQVAKMDHVCRKLGLRPGQRVLEAGCGWGSLALHMVRHYGVTVRAYNISGEQSGVRGGRLPCRPRDL